MKLLQVDLWALSSLSVVVVEFALSITLLFRSSERHKQQKSPTDLLVNYLLFFGAITMHSLLEMSGLQLGRFSYLMMILYIPLVPQGWPEKLFHSAFSLFSLESAIKHTLSRRYPRILHPLVALLPLVVGSFLLLSTITPLFPDLSGCNSTQEATLWAITVTIVSLSPSLLSCFSKRKSDHKQARVHSHAGRSSKRITSALIFLLCCLFVVSLHHTTRFLDGKGQIREFHRTAAHQAASHGNFSLAIDHYRWIIQLYPDDADSYGDMAMFLDARQQPGDQEEAHQNFRLVYDHLDPENIKALAGLLMYAQDMVEVCSLIPQVERVSQRVMQSPCQYQNAIDCEQLKGFVSGFVMQRLLPTTKEYFQCE